MAYIYKHTNKTNGKVYIGKTTQKPSRRWRNGKAYKSCTYFNAAINKYGWDGFDHEVLEIVEDLNILKEREQYYIEQYKALDPKFGYNTIKLDMGLNVYPEHVKSKISTSRKKYLAALDSPLEAPNKRYHIIKDNGQVVKLCKECGVEKDLSEFSQDKNRWDNLTLLCRPCHVNAGTEYKKTLTPEELALSYKTRAKNISIGLKLKAETDPNYGAEISKRKCKPILRTYLNGTTKRYNNTYELKAENLTYSCVIKSIKNKTVYKDSHFSYLVLVVEKPEYLIFDEERNDNIKMSVWKSILNNEKMRIFARNCVVKELTHKEQYDFCKINHLQGGCNAAIKYGLLYNNELVAVMTFGKPRYNKKYQYELIRFCSKLNTQVIGGASKLFKLFISQQNPKSVISYANCRFSKGNLYEKLGFKYISKTAPNYFYSKDGQIQNRTNFQKHKLAKKLENYNPELTEKQNMYNNGYTITRDWGNLVYVIEF